MAARQTSSWLTRKAGKPKVRASRPVRDSAAVVAKPKAAASGEAVSEKREGGDDWGMRLSHGRTQRAVEKPASTKATSCGRVWCEALVRGAGRRAREAFRPAGSRRFGACGGG